VAGNQDGCDRLAISDRTVVKSATLDSMIALATRLAYLSCFSCSIESPLDHRTTFDRIVVRYDDNRGVRKLSSVV
jgi:hypothetical protein